MRKILFGATALLLVPALSACCDDNKTTDEPAQPEAVQLITPNVSARIADPLNQNPFTGILEIYPCYAETSTYYGNYINSKKTVFNGYYTIIDGHIYGEYNRPLQLPVGTYNMVYWGTPKYDDPIYNTPAINEPGITQDADLSTLYFRLRANTDGTYMPVYDLVHAVKPANVGQEDLQAALTRVTAGIRIIAKMQDNSEFNPSITNIQARIGGIAEKMNFYTAEVENTTKVVKFDLERSDDNTIMSNATVMLFRSSSSSPWPMVPNTPCRRTSALPSRPIPNSPSTSFWAKSCRAKRRATSPSKTGTKCAKPSNSRLSTEYDQVHSEAVDTTSPLKQQGDPRSSGAALLSYLRSTVIRSIYNRYTIFSGTAPARHSTPSSRSKAALRSTPPAYPVRLPSHPTTRWQGTTILTGLCPTAPPTACADTRPPPRSRSSCRAIAL